MIYKRFAANLRAQNWFAIGVELLIVIVGVFIGTWVADWNAERLEERETRQLLLQLEPELDFTLRTVEGMREYYGITTAHAELAMREWDNPGTVSDEEFVVSAYQASQIAGFLVSGESWSTMFGAEQVRQIQRPELREALVRLLSYNWDSVIWEWVDSDYRHEVRATIPNDVQGALRAQCGDRFNDKERINILPETCDLDFDADRIAAAASELHGRPELARMLRWHVANIDSYRQNMTSVETFTTNLKNEIEKAH